MICVDDSDADIWLAWVLAWMMDAFSTTQPDVSGPDCGFQGLTGRQMRSNESKRERERE